VLADRCRAVAPFARAIGVMRALADGGQRCCLHRDDDVADYDARNGHRECKPGGGEAGTHGKHSTIECVYWQRWGANKEIEGTLRSPDLLWYGLLI